MGALFLFLVPVMLLGVVFVNQQLDRAVLVQRAVEDAERRTSDILVLQLDEETGLRGYIATGRRELFLEPYLRAVERFPPAVDALRAALEAADADQALPEVDRIVAANALWQAAVASPTLTAGNTVGAPVQLHGKNLVDGVRAAVAAIGSALAAAGARSAARTSSTIEFTLWAGVLAVVGIGLAGVLYARQRAAVERTLLEQQKSLAIAQQAYATEKRIADTLRDAFIVRALPVLPGVGFHAQYVPSSVEAQVGGDWYDAFELADGRVFFSIGDVAGHGLDAAVAMNRARQAIVAAALHENDPGTVLTRANETILTHEARMVTALCGYIDPGKFEVCYAGAGHPPPILALPGRPATTLATGGIPLGVVAGTAYQTSRASAGPEGVLVLYTDGVTKHGRDVVAGEQRLLATVAEVAAAPGLDPAAAIREAIFRDAAPADDVAILTVTFRTPKPAVVGVVRPPITAGTGP